MGDPGDPLAAPPGIAFAATQLLLRPESSSQIQMGSWKGKQGWARLADGWESCSEAGLGLGPTPPALPCLQRVQPPRLHLALRSAPNTPPTVAASSGKIQNVSTASALYPPQRD